MIVWVVFAAIALVAAAFAVAPLVWRRGARVSAAIIGVGIAVAGLLLYSALGRPELAARMFQPTEQKDMRGLVAELAVRMRAHPNELQGWLLLGREYFRLGAVDEAAKAFGRAARLARSQPMPAPARAAILAEYGIALSQAMGQVTPDAEAILTEAVAGDPKNAMARYYLGLAAAEHGDFAKAEQWWQAVLTDTPADAPYRGEIVDRLAALKAAGVARGENAPDVHAMVEGLAARLASNPNDLDGWRRLVRAYAVMGETDKAKVALTRARAAFAANKDAMAALAQTARDSKLE